MAGLRRTPHLGAYSIPPDPLTGFSWLDVGIGMREKGEREERDMLWA